jgi:hypothetical protein
MASYRYKRLLIKRANLRSSDRATDLLFTERVFSKLVSFLLSVNKHTSLSHNLYIKTGYFFKSLYNKN